MYDDPTTTKPTPQPPGNGDFARLRLLRSRRVGVVTYQRLVREYRSAKAALAVLPDVASAAGVCSYQVWPEAVIHAEFKAAKARDAWLLTEDDGDYPENLRNLGDQPPVE